MTLGESPFLRGGLLARSLSDPTVLTLALLLFEIYFMCIYALLICTDVYPVCSWSIWRRLAHLILELEMVVSLDVVLGTELAFSETAVCSVNP